MEGDTFKIVGYHYIPSLTIFGFSGSQRMNTLRDDDEPESTGNRGFFLELVHLLVKYNLVQCEYILRNKLAKKITKSYMSSLKRGYINFGRKSKK